MANTGLGMNLDGLFLSVADKIWLEETYKNSPPDALVVLNNIHYAIHLKRQFPETLVCYRTFWGNEYDNIWKTTSVDHFLQIYEDAIKNNLVIYTNNEPTLTTELCEWEYELSRKIIERKASAVQFNWSVGMPSESDETFDKWKKNLQIIGNNKNRLYLGLHEYFFGHPFSEIMDDASVRAMESVNIHPQSKLSILGRYRWVLDYCRRNNIITPNIIFTEYGWDEIHALHHKIPTFPSYENPFRIPTILPSLEVWANQSNMSLENYVFKQFVYAWEKIYRYDKEVKGVCFFPFGGTGAWDVASIHRFKQIAYKLMKDYDFSYIGDDEDEGEDEMILNGDARRVIYTGKDINFRKTASTNQLPIFTLTAGTHGFIFPNDTVNDGTYIWTPAIFNKDNKWKFGYYASNLSGVTFENYDENPDVDMTKIRTLVAELDAVVNG